MMRRGEILLLMMGDPLFIVSSLLMFDCLSSSITIWKRGRETGSNGCRYIKEDERMKMMRGCEADTSSKEMRKRGEEGRHERHVNRTTSHRPTTIISIVNIPLLKSRILRPTLPSAPQPTTAHDIMIPMCDSKT